MKIDKRLCWNEDRTRLVPQTSAEAAWLAYIPGDEIPDAEARKYGLTPGPEAKSDTPAAAGDPDDKATAPAADKARRAAANK